MHKNDHSRAAQNCWTANHLFVCHFFPPTHKNQLKFVILYCAYSSIFSNGLHIKKYIFHNKIKMTPPYFCNTSIKLSCHLIHFVTVGRRKTKRVFSTTDSLPAQRSNTTMEIIANAAHSGLIRSCWKCAAPLLRCIQQSRWHVWLLLYKPVLSFFLFYLFFCPLQENIPISACNTFRLCRRLHFRKHPFLKKNSFCFYWICNTWGIRWSVFSFGKALLIFWSNWAAKHK